MENQNQNKLDLQNSERLSDKYKPNQMNTNGSNGQQNNIVQNNQPVMSGPNQPPQNRAGINQGVKMDGREAMIKMMVGETGSGKTEQIIKECIEYARDNYITGKKARPVYIFNPNVLFEPKYLNTFPNHIRLHELGRHNKPEVYIILPINEDGSIMSDEQKREATLTTVNTVRKCLLVLDDLDDVFKGAKPRDMDKLFVSYRHRSIDLITTHQFLNPITTQEWGAVTTISLRKTVQSVSIIKDRVPNPEILYIAEMIVAEQYLLADTMRRGGKISEDEYRKRRSFFVEVNIRTNRIKGGFSKECFSRNCRKFLNLNSNRISDYQKIYCDKDGRALYNRETTIQRIITRELWRYFSGRE